MIGKITSSFALLNVFYFADTAKQTGAPPAHAGSRSASFSCPSPYSISARSFSSARFSMREI